MILFAEEAEPIVEIDKIVITEQIEDASAPLVPPNDVLSVQKLKIRPKTVAESLSHTAGVHIRRLGSVEEDSIISIRGSTPQQVEVFLDDIPLQSASDQGHSLAKMMTQIVSKVEVFKSVTPVDLGVSPIGGTLRISTQEIERGVHQRYGLGVGSFLALDAFAEFSRGGVDHDFVLGMQYRRTNGDFRFLDDNGTPLNATDDAMVKRTNNESQTVHPYLKWNYRFDDRTKLSWTHHFLRTDEGVPGLGIFQAARTDLSTTEWLSNLKLERQPVFSDKVKIENQLYTRWVKSQFTDPFGELGLGATQDNDNSTVVVGDRLNWKTNFSDVFRLNHSLETIFEWFIPKDYAAAQPFGSTSKRQQLNFGTEAQLKMWQEKIRITATGQNLNSFYDINNGDPSLKAPGTFFSSRTDNNFAGSLALVYQPFQVLHLKTSVGRLVRLPKFMELFGDQGRVVGNPQLQSEKALKYDAGLLFQPQWQGVLDRFHLETAYFESQMTDLIQFEIGSGFSRASNLGKAVIRGIETNLGFRLAKDFRFSANYTFQLAKDKATRPGNYLIGRPKHELNAECLFEHGPWFASFGGNYMDQQFLDSLNTQVVRNRIVINAAAGYTLKKRWRFGIQANNLTNSRVVDSVGFPLPGRNFYGRVDFSY